MGNQQSAPHEDSLVVLTPDEERQLSDLSVNIPVGGYRSTPELREHLHDTIFGANQASESESSEPMSPALQNLTKSPELANLLRLGDGEQIDINALAAVLSQLNKTLTNNDLAVLRKALFPAVDSDASLLTSREYRGSIMRKRSLRAPGTASRSKAHKLKKQPTAKDAHLTVPERPKTWAMEQLTVTSPLSAIASLQDRSPNERGSMPTRRPTTPSDLECSNLGAIQLGTLRVTNGAVTPEPSILSGHAPNRPLPSPNDDYFTCSEGLQTDDDGFSPGNAPTDDSQSTISANDSPTTPNAAPRFHVNRLSKKPQHKLAISPMGSQKIQRHHLGDTGIEAAAGPEPLNLYSSEALSNPFANGEDDHSQEAYGLVPTVTPATQIDDRSRHRMPDAESIYSELTPKNSLNNKTSNQDALSRLIGQPSTRYPPSQAAAPRSVPTQYDRMQPYTPAKPALLGPHSMRSGPTARNPTAPLTVQTSLTPGIDFPTTSIPTPPFAQGTPNSPSSSPFAIDKEGLKCDSPVTPLTAPAKSHSTADILDMKPPVPITDSPVSLPGSAEGGKKRNKLQKKRFSKQQEQAQSIQLQSITTPPLGSVPAIAPHIAASHHKRMIEFPTMDSLDHTFETASAVDVRSPSPEPSAVNAIRFPSPTRAEDTPKSSRGRQSRRSSIGPGTSPSRILRSLSRRRSKSRKATDSHEVIEGDVFNVQDFGYVPEMTSRDSPYHAVVRPTTRPQSADVSQLSRSKGPGARTKPTKGMDDKTASELAKWRSRDRLVNDRDLFEPLVPSKQPEPSRAATPHHQKPLPSKPTLPKAAVIPPIPQMQSARQYQRPQSYAGPARAEPLQTRKPFATPQPEPSPTAFVDPGNEESSQVHEGVWKTQAEFWKKQKEQPLLQQASSTPQKQASFDEPSEAKPQPQSHLSPLAAAPKFELPRGGARSPSPSILERAALFEQADSRSGSPRGSPSPPRARVKQQTAAAHLSSYESTGSSAQAQASSGAADKLRDIMSSGGPGEQRWKARSLVGGGAGLEGPYADMRAALRHVS